MKLPGRLEYLYPDCLCTELHTFLLKIAIAHLNLRDVCRSVTKTML